MAVALIVIASLLPQGTTRISERAVDYVGLRSGPPLFGVILQTKGKTATMMAVQRGWLRKQSAERYEKYRTREVQQYQQSQKKLIERLEAWMKHRKDDKDLMDYLQTQLLRQKAKENKPAPEPQLMLIEISPSMVRTTKPAQRERRQVLLLALREKLEKVETRSAQDLADELKEKQVQVPKGPVNLTDRALAPADNEQQWAARQAIIEQLYRKPVKMRGTRDFVIQESNDNKQIDAQKLAMDMMQKQMNRLIADLTEPTARRKPAQAVWLTETIKAAKKTNSRAAHVAMVIPDPTLQAAVVESKFLARLPDGKWVVLWSDRQSVKPVEDPEAEQQLRDNEQLGGLLDALGGLGKGDAVNKALRFGTATREAHRLAEAAYVEWRDPFYDDLSGPMIRIPRGR